MGGGGHQSSAFTNAPACLQVVSAAGSLPAGGASLPPRPGVGPSGRLAGLWGTSASQAAGRAGALGAAAGAGGGRVPYQPTAEEVRNDYTVVPIDLSRWAGGRGSQAMCRIEDGLGRCVQHEDSMRALRVAARPYRPLTCLPACHAAGMRAWRATKATPSCPRPAAARRCPPSLRSSWRVSGAALRQHIVVFSCSGLVYGAGGRLLQIHTAMRLALRPRRSHVLPLVFPPPAAARRHQEDVEQGKSDPFLLFPDIAK